MVSENSSLQEMGRSRRVCSAKMVSDKTLEPSKKYLILSRVIQQIVIINRILLHCVGNTDVTLEIE